MEHQVLNTFYKVNKNCRSIRVVFLATLILIFVCGCKPTIVSVNSMRISDKGFGLRPEIKNTVVLNNSYGWELLDSDQIINYTKINDTLVLETSLDNPKDSILLNFKKNKKEHYVSIPYFPEPKFKPSGHPLSWLDSVDFNNLEYLYFNAIDMKSNHVFPGEKLYFSIDDKKNESSRGAYLDNTTIATIYKSEPEQIILDSFTVNYFDTSIAIPLNLSLNIKYDKKVIDLKEDGFSCPSLTHSFWGLVTLNKKDTMISFARNNFDCNWLTFNDAYLYRGLQGYKVEIFHVRVEKANGQVVLNRTINTHIHCLEDFLNYDVNQSYNIEITGDRFWSGTLFIKEKE